MSLLGVFFAILSPAAYAVTNYFDKFFLEKYNIRPLVLAIYSGIVAFLASIILIFIIGFHSFPITVIFSTIFSGFFIELYLLPYFKAMSLEDASTVVPLMQLYPLYVIVGDAIILGETLSILQYIGGFLIVLSGLVIAADKIDSYIIRPRKAFWYIQLSNLSLAAATLLFKHGVGDQDFWKILPYEGFGVFLCAVLIFVLPGKNLKTFKHQTSELKKKVFLLMFANEIVYISARYFGFYALSLISASLVGILAGLQPLFVLIFGIILSVWFPYILKEITTKKTITLKLISTIVIIIGLILLSI